MKKQKLFLSLPFLAMSLSLVSCNNKRAIQDYILEMPYKENFKILQLTDIHFSSLESDSWINAHLNFMKGTIDLASTDGHKPDLIVITGDSSYEGNKHTADMLFTWLDEQKIPWTITFGNHDTRSYFSMDWLLNRITSSKYSVFKNMGNDGIHGDANFAINLVNENGKVKDQIIMIDSNRYRPGDHHFESYDYIYPEQVEWYKNLVEYTTKQNGGIPVPSYAFFHIPLNEFAEAWNYHVKGEGSEHGVVFHRGEHREGECPPSVNTGLFSMMKQLKSTRAVMTGHDHVNDYWLTYQGIHLIYGIKSTGHKDIVYCDLDMLGGRCYNLEHVDDDNFVNDHIHTFTPPEE